MKYLKKRITLISLIAVTWAVFPLFNLPSPFLKPPKPPEIFAQQPSELFNDNFDGPLSQWQIIAEGNNSITSAVNFDGKKVLKIHYQTASSAPILLHIFNSPQQGIFKIRFYDHGPGRGSAGFSVANADNSQAVIVGVHPNFPNTYFCRAGENQPWNLLDTKMGRTQGWHTFEIRVTPKGSYCRIDEQSLSWLPTERIETNQLAKAVNVDLRAVSRIGIWAVWGHTGDYYWDDFSSEPLPALPESAQEKERHFLEVFADITPREAYFYKPRTRVVNWSSAAIVKAERALILAILNRNEAEINEAKRLINEVVQMYARFPDNPTYGWGNPLDSSNPELWVAPTKAAPLGTAAWLLWDRLTQAERTAVKNIVVEQANYWSSQAPKTGHVGDTKAEENAWTAGFLALAANMFPNESNSQRWERMARTYAFHTFTTGETYNGYTTKTVYFNDANVPNYLVENHNLLPHPNYGPASAILLAQADYFYRRAGRTLPGEFSHNLRNVWEAHQPYINQRDYHFKNYIRIPPNIPEPNPYDFSYLWYSGKDDWSYDGTYLNATLGLLAKLDPGAYRQEYNNLLDYEFYITPDHLMYPIEAQPPYTNIPNVQNPVYERIGAAAWMHASAYLLQQSPTPTPTNTPTPPPTATPTPTLTPTPTPTPIPGDFNQDGRVDILDLRHVLSNFTNIFDYNLVVGNFEPF